MKISLGKRIFMLLLVVLIFAALRFQGKATAYEREEGALQSQLASDSIANPKAYVGIVQSAKANASDLTYEDIKAMVKEAVELAGGFDTLIHDGMTVLLKPNLVAVRDYSSNPKPLPKEVNGVTTDWRVVKAVSELVREKNPHGKIYVGEGSGASLTGYAFNFFNYTKGNMTEVDSFICFEKSGSWNDYNSSDMVKVILPDNKAIYPHNLKPNKTKEFYLNKTYMNADVVISMPVLKNHVFTGITGAIKNVGIGATPANIYGTSASNPSRQDNNRIDHIDYNWMDNLHRWVHDYYLCRKVDYVIMDGLQGLQNGPVSLEGFSPNLQSDQKNMRLMIAGKDALAVDAIEALIMYFDPRMVNHLFYLGRDTVGCIDPAYIKVKGKQVHEVKKKFIFSTEMPGSKSRMNDATPPACRIDSFRVTGSRLHLSLSGKDIAKVEVVYDGVILNEAGVRNFGNLVFDLKRSNIDESKIDLLIYDRFLNCTKQSVTAVKEEKTNKAGAFDLKQNFPNPFNPSTTISFRLPKGENVKLTVYDNLGKKVAVLLEGYKTEGEHRVSFNGGRYSSGVYFYSLTAGTNTVTKRMVLTK